VSEERYRAIFEYSPDAVFQTVPDGTILDANPAACRMFGYSNEEMCAVGREGISDINDPRLKDALEERKKTEKILAQITSIRKDGTKFESEITSNIYKSKDGNMRSIVILRDITQLKTYQKELARLDRLNLIGEMAAGIGHEIRNPMTTVKGFLQLFREKREFANYFEQLDLMVEEIDRANSIITEFLSLAKNKVIDLNRRSLNKIIKSLYPLIQADAMKSDNNIALELEDIPMLLLDEKEMRQVILNLVRNGLEAMQPGGNLTIRTFIEEGEVVLSVQDQGTGIKPEVLEKLGTPFFTTKDNGTGLGLAVCYSLAARHKARIDVDTGPLGTTFYFRFKLKKQR
jgi:PAS domain S-box-containing protein